MTTGRTPFDIKIIRAEWAALAEIHAGSQEGERFLILLHSLREWNGERPPPKTVSANGEKPSRDFKRNGTAV